MSVFNPVTGLVGGSIIGLSAVTLLLANGDVMGASGIVTSSILSHVSTISDVTQRWKIIFIGCFVAVVNVMMYTAAANDNYVLLSTSTASPLAYTIGGFCVGVGTKLANGCTSGHGVCGLGRLSTRSFVSVLLFLTSGIFVTTFISSPHTPWASSTSFLRQQGGTNGESSFVSTTILLLTSCLTVLSYAMNNNKNISPQEQSSYIVPQRKSFGAAISGALFAGGLGISGMTQTGKVLGFLDINPLLRSNIGVSYDPTLLTVLGAAVPISALGYIIQRYFMKELTLCGADWSGIPNRTDIDSQLVIGSALFGIGWGLVGLCPGPGVWSAAAGVRDVVYMWFPAFLLGSFLGKQILNSPSKQKRI